MEGSSVRESLKVLFQTLPVVWNSALAASGAPLKLQTRVKPSANPNQFCVACPSARLVSVFLSSGIQGLKEFHSQLSMGKGGAWEARVLRGLLVQLLSRLG